jgi:hypothetical protein
MLWQLAAATVIGSLFYVRRVFTWVKEHVAFRPARNADKHNAEQKQVVESTCSR